MTFATLRALHAVIGAALDDMERVYREQAPGLDFPSLDDPYYTNGPHSHEEELVENLRGEPVVAATCKSIVAACGQLNASVNKPWFGLMEEVQGAQLAECIHFMETANVVEILREAGPGGMHVKDILTNILDLLPKSVDPKIPTALNVTHLSHILRLLATMHYLREVKPDVFANNRRSSYIYSGKSVAQLRAAPGSKYTDTDGVAAFVGLTGDEAIKFSSALTQWAIPAVAHGTFNANFALPSSAQSNGDATASKQKESGVWSSADGEVPHAWAPFNLAFATPLGYFSWLELPGNDVRLKRFGHAMTGTRQWETKDGVLHGFSWDALPEGSVLVDVGGGIGSTSITVAEAHPHIRVVVEDREQVVSTAQSAWGSRHAPLFESGRMSYRARDFLEPWKPLVLPNSSDASSTPAVFLVRLILHDWQDREARKILGHLRAAAGPDTKLLIGDMLLPYACRSEEGENVIPGASDPFVPEGSPLLPNLGKANVHGYLIDIMMMAMFDAREKTVGEMAALLLSAGWKAVEVRRTPGALWAYTTAVPV